MNKNNNNESIYIALFQSGTAQGAILVVDGDDNQASWHQGGTLAHFNNK